LAFQLPAPLLGHGQLPVRYRRPVWCGTSVSFLGHGGSAGCLRLYVANKRARNQFPQEWCPDSAQSSLCRGGGAAHGLRRASRLYA
jgi:hypothetical protein